MEYLLERLMMLYKKLQAALAELEGMESEMRGRGMPRRPTLWGI